MMGTCKKKVSPFLRKKMYIAILGNYIYLRYLLSLTVAPATLGLKDEEILFGGPGNPGRCYLSFGECTECMLNFRGEKPTP